MESANLKERIEILGRLGCRGSLKDFQGWLAHSTRALQDVDQLQECLDDLVDLGSFRVNNEFINEYEFAGELSFPEKMELELISDLKYSPVQMVRSRLESFLAYFHIARPSIIDIIVGTTEALENAIKYSPPRSRIQVSWELQEKLFSIRIENLIMEARPEQDIQRGKYQDGKATLMRGIMVMQKVFTKISLNVLEEKMMASFYGEKELDPPARLSLRQ